MITGDVINDKPITMAKKDEKKEEAKPEGDAKESEHHAAESWPDAEKEGTEDVRASRIDRCSRLFFARKVREGAMAHASSRASSCHWAPRSLTVADRSGDEHRAVSEEDHGVVGR